MKYEEIPNYVMLQVYRKWKRIAKKGRWNNKYWTPCALCDWLISHGGCHECPLRKGEWCTGNGQTSRLCGNEFDGETNQKRWLMDVNRFVSMMRKRLKERGVRV